MSEEIKLDFSFNASKSTIRKLNQIITRIEENPALKNINVGTSLDSDSQQLFNLFNKEIEKSGTEMQKAGAKTAFLDTKFGKLLNTVSTVFGSKILALPQLLFSATTATILEVDKQFNQLKQTMSADTDFKRMLEGSIELSKELGRSLADVNKSIIEVAKKGYNGEQTLELARTMTVTQNVTDIGSDQSYATITTAMNAFNIQAYQSMSIIDQLNSLNNAFGVSNNELAASLQQTANAAASIGVSMAELLGDSTALMQVTRESGAVTSNALQTIYANLTSSQPAIEALSGIGISIEGANGQLKSATQLLDEAALSWRSLTKQEQLHNAQSIAGEKHAARFMALMDNRHSAHEATTVALHSEGSAMQDNAAYMESYEARVNRLRAAWQQFSLSVGNAVVNDALTGLLQIGTSLITVLNSVINKVGFLPVLFGATGIAVYALNGKVKELANNFANKTIALIKMPAILKSVNTSSKALAFTFRVLGTSIRTLLAASGVGLILTAVGFAAEFLFNKISKTKEAIDDTSDSLEALKTKSTEAGRLEELSTQYNDLANKPSLSAEDKMSLSNIEQELEQNYQLSLSPLDEERTALALNNDLIEQKLGLLREEIALKREEASLAFRSNESQIREDISSQKQAAEEAREKLQNRKNVYDEFRRRRDAGETITNSDEFFFHKELNFMELNSQNDYHANDIEDLGEILAKEIADAERKVSEANESYSQSIQKATSGLQGEFRNYLDMLEISGEELKPATRVVFDALAGLDAEFGLNLDTNDLDSFFQQLNAIDVTSIEQIEELFKERFPESSQQFSKALKQIETDLARMNFSKSNRAIENGADQVSDSLTAQQEKFRSTSNEVKQFNQLLHDMNNEQYLNSEAALDLILKYPELASNIEQTSKGWKLSTTALENLRKTKVLEAQSAVTAQIQSTKATLNNTLSRVNAYGLELDAIKNLKSAHEEVGKLGFIRQYGEDAFETITFDDENNRIYTGTGKKGFTEWKDEQQYNRIKQDFMEQKSSRDSIIKLGELQEQQEVYEKLLNDPNYGVPTRDGGSSSGPKDEPRKKDSLDAYINGINTEAEKVRKANEELESSMSEDDPYSVRIDNTSKLLEGKHKEIDELKKANSIFLDEMANLQAGQKSENLSDWFDSNGEATEYYINLFNSLSTGKAQDQLEKLFNKYKAYREVLEDNESRIASLTSNNKSLLQSLDDLKLAYTENYLEQRTKALEEYDNKMKKSQQIQSTYEEHTTLWNKEAKKQLNILYEKKHALNRENDSIRKKLKQNEKAQQSERLTAEQIAALNAQLKANSDAWYDTVNAIQSTMEALEDYRKSQVDQIIGKYKDMLKQQKDLELKAIDERIKNEDELHEKIMDNYGEQLDQIKKTIDAQKHALDRKYAEEDHERDMDKLLQEESVIQQKLHTIRLDDSYEGKARRNELDQELADIRKQIQEKQLERGRELEKEALDDRMQDAEKHYGELEDIENKRHEKERQNLALDKELRQQHWDSILENEQYFSELKSQLLSNDVAIVQTALGQMKEEYQTFFSYLRTNAESLGSMFDTLFTNLKPDYSQLEEFPITSLADEFNAMLQKDWEEYLHNKFKAESIKDPKNEQFQQLHARNTELRDKWGFKDGSYNELKNIQIVYNPSLKQTKETVNWKSEMQSFVPSVMQSAKNDLLENTPSKGISNLAIQTFNGITQLFEKTPPPSSSTGTLIENIAVSLQGNVLDGADFAEKFMGGLTRKGIRIGR
ncbi:phage tail tape measure protein [Paenibacillus sp. J5C_2022]|uniref:phage tail tape measure protein n=1 Tax=Paenibacillus sp. J5C2022 TaxID=2977129 RepID=UPI0021CFD50A|nr:phage tail tape measure protein [Paenibacillus sp. J5C2022]MCU6710073.1 phage tail tape measure protein [Paenibacillus sp. J5C2022]